MHRSLYSRAIIVIIAFAMAVFFGSCSNGAYPVNVGREYGNPTIPLFVSHLPKSNQWALARTGRHFFLRKIICFDFTCRKMIGRRKTLHAISFADYKKRIEKNAKKGEIKKLSPGIKTLKLTKPDTIKIPKALAQIAGISAPIQESAAPTPILKADSLIVLNELLFQTNSFKLQGKHYSTLDSIAQFLLTHPTLEVRVSGHTDNTGNERHNVSLSTNRAEVVAEYLISKGVMDNNVSFQGFGSVQPMTGNETQQGRSMNRRVEILIRNPEKK